MRTRLFGVALAVAFFATGCSPAVRGSGVIKTDQRDTAAVTSINVSGAYEVEIVAQKDPRLELEGDDNILPLIHTDLVDGKLIVSSDDRFNATKPIKIRISTPTLRGLTASGAHTIAVRGVSVDDFDLQSSGASHIVLDGQVDSLSITTSGADTIDAKQLLAKRAAVTSSGAGTVSVRATEELNAEASGAGSVIYFGDPKAVHPTVSGAASVRKG